MATHDVALKVATELPVGAVDLEIPVKRNGRKIGTFTVNANGVSWNPATARAATSVSWEDLPAALSGTPAAASATAAKKTTAKKTAAKKTAAPVSVPDESDTETATPAAAPAKKTTAKRAAKKSASATGAAVDARAVRAWAAENGISVAPRGPISSSIIDQFRAAQ
ncbi:MAG: Lsr2 family DNA-binding protein [Janthinobacterium lividum]